MGLERVTPQDIIRALSPLLGNTIISPSDRDWNKVRAEKPDPGEFIREYMNDLGGRIHWVKCPACEAEWNALTPTGKCISCEDKKTEAIKRDYENGVYLRRVLGLHGLQNYGFQNFKVHENNRMAFETCRDFDPVKQNLYIYGSCGTGKTHLAGALLKSMAAKGMTLKWVTPIYLGRGLRSQYAQGEKSFIDSLTYQDVLVIDDVGVGRDSYAILQAVYEILEDRRARCKNGMVMTSNWSPQKIAEKFDDRLSSRIGGMCKIVEVAGEDWRLRREGTLL